jgi:hypothetical protein
MVWSAITEFTAFSVRSFAPDMTCSRRGRLVARAASSPSPPRAVKGEVARVSDRPEKTVPPTEKETRARHKIIGKKKKEGSQTILSYIYRALDISSVEFPC